jgi:multiple sugar transport system substrate-binding protein
LYYRDDVLRYFNLQVPRTWDEYNEVAKAVHGKVYQNTTLVGSCVGRVKDFAGPYWANLVISSLTQTQGQFEGHLFSTVDLEPLTGPAIEKALEWMEGQVLYGMVDGKIASLEFCGFDRRIGVSHVRSVALKLTPFRVGPGAT